MLARSDTVGTVVFHILLLHHRLFRGVWAVWTRLSNGNTPRCWNGFSWITNSINIQKLFIVQGMSDIAGMLLIYIMDEEEAFWALAQLLDGPRHKMHCLFVRDFPGLKRYFTHHDRVLRIHLRKVWKHFKKEQVDCCTYAFKWYMQCFLGRVSCDSTLFSAFQ